MTHPYPSVDKGPQPLEGNKLLFQKIPLQGLGWVMFINVNNPQLSYTYPSNASCF